MPKRNTSVLTHIITEPIMNSSKEVEGSAAGEAAGPSATGLELGRALGLIVT
jgi:hypothetical protein